MSKSFSRGGSYNGRHPDNMIKAMAYFELFYMGQLRKNSHALTKYKEYHDEGKKQKSGIEAKVRSLIGTNKGRKAMREALGMTIELDPATAIKRFWALGALLALGEPKEIETDELFSEKKVILFAVPGAFSPTCNNSHLPSFIEKYDEIKGKGIDNIICLSVNDQFVSKVWRDSKSLNNDFLFIADGNAQITDSLGMVLDCSGFGMGKRSNRYVMVIDDKVIKKLIVEDNPGVCDLTNANEILNSL